MQQRTLSSNTVQVWQQDFQDLLRNSHNYLLLTTNFLIKYSLCSLFFPELGASDRPCASTYCGSAPESEKESKALADFIRENLSTIKAYLTVHSYSQLLVFPYSYTYKLAKDYNELVSTSSLSFWCNEKNAFDIMKEHYVDLFNFRQLL